MEGYVYPRTGPATSSAPFFSPFFLSSSLLLVLLYSPLPSLLSLPALLSLLANRKEKKKKVLLFFWWPVVATCRPEILNANQPGGASHVPLPIWPPDIKPIDSLLHTLYSRTLTLTLTHSYTLTPVRPCTRTLVHKLTSLPLPRLISPAGPT